MPPKEDGTKAPDAGPRWKHYQVTPPDREQLTAWYANGRTGIGIVTGTGAGPQKIELLETDDPDVYQPFRDTAESIGLGELIERIEAGYMERTPKGGIHLLYRCSEVAGNTLLAGIPTDDADGKPSIHKLIETRGIGGYVIVAPSFGAVHESGKPYELISGGFDTIVTITPEERDALHQLARVFDLRPKREISTPVAATVDGNRPGDVFNAQATWPAILEPHGWTFVTRHGATEFWRRPGKDRGWSATINGAGVGPDRLYVFSSSTTLEAQRSYTKFQAYTYLEHAGDFAAAAKAVAKRGPVLKLSSRATGRRATADDELPDGITLEDFRAYMQEHRYIFIPNGKLWPSSSVNARLGKVPDGDTEVQATAWLDRHRPVEAMTWAPGEPPLIEDRLISDGGWINRPGLNCFNLYIGPTIEHGDASQASPWIDHVERVYPDEAAHIIAWLAHRAQQPGQKINHAIVLGGSQGIGKDTILVPAKQAVGPWNVSEVSPAHLLRRFNSFVKSVILSVSEARDLGDVDRYSFYEHLKVYTAAPPDVLRCDEKNVQEYSVLNVCGVVITTNHKTDGIYLPADDRRHFVAWSEAVASDFDGTYWQDLYRWYETGGNAHVAAYLAAYDLSDFDPKAPPPKTPAFWDIVDANRAPEDGDMSDALEKLHFPDALTLDSIAGVTSGDFATWLKERKNARQIPHRMESAGYVPVRNERTKDGRWKVGGKNLAVYARRDLSVRDRIVAAYEVAGGPFQSEMSVKSVISYPAQSSPSDPEYIDSPKFHEAHGREEKESESRTSRTTRTEPDDEPDF